MNAPGLHEKLAADDGRVARLAKGDMTPRAIVEELYLLAYSRLPDRRGDERRRGALRATPGATAARRSRTCSGPC